MSNIVISIEDLSKSYHLGVISTGTFYGDLKRWWARKLGNPDPYLRIGDTDHGNRDGEMIWALRNVNFTVRQGEALGVIGRNGAGKSTLLKILSQVTAPTSGVVKVKGRIASLLEVGTGFHPELTGRENVYLNGAIMGMDRAEVSHKFDEIVDFSGVEKFIDTPVKRYSSGMYVRLAFAVAAHLEPEILIVDEVLAVGDAEFQKKCLGKMKAVTGEGRTVLFVSHNMASISAFCQRALLLRAGELRNSGNPDDVIGYYLKSSVIASFSAANLLEHPNRRPNMKPIIAKLNASNGNGEVTNLFKVGDDIIFNITLEPREVEIKHPAVSIAILNNVGDQILKLASWAQAIEWDLLAERVTVQCVWKDCRLAPGKYFINIGLGEGKGTVDYIEHVTNIEIAPQTDEYRTGRIPPGIFLPKVEWAVDGSNLL
jgi:lipopolysaccharide transport system ATP-binding protein